MSDNETASTYLYAAIFLTTVLLFGLGRVLRLGLLVVVIDSYVKYVNKLEADYERRCLDAAIQAAASKECSISTKAWNYCLSFYTSDNTGQCPLNKTQVLEQQRQFHQVTGKLEILIKFILELLWLVVDEVTVKVFGLLEKIVVGVEAKNWFQWIMMQFRATVHDNLLKPVLAVVIVFTLSILILFNVLNLWRLFRLFLSYCGLCHPSIDAVGSAKGNVPIKSSLVDDSSSGVVVCKHCNGSGKLPNRQLKYVANVYYLMAKKKEKL